MNPIAKILQTQAVMILDGALATELERQGCDLNDPLWSAKILLENPNLIKQIHTNYFEAGADCAISASYQATFEGFARRGLNRNEVADLMRLTIRLALEARDEFWANPANRLERTKPIIAASVGSYGAYLADGSEYRGDYGLSKVALMDFHRPRLAVLADTKADIIACETIPCLLEAQVLADLLAEFPQLTAWISFSAKDEYHISHGELLADCVASLEPYSQIVAVGINCTPPKYIPTLIKSARAKTSKPIIVYPNSGETYAIQSKTWQGQGDQASYAQQAQYWYECGAKIIGGCCRTTPTDIKQIATTLRFKDLDHPKGL